MKNTWWLKALLCAFILLPFLAVLFVSFTLWQDSNAWRAAVAQGVTSSSVLSDATTAATLLKQELDIYEKHASSLQQMISILLGLSSLYAAVLGLGAYVGTSKVLEEGQKVSGELEKLKATSETKLREMVTESRTDLDGVSRDSRARLQHMADATAATLAENERKAEQRLDHIARRADQQALEFGRNIRQEYPVFGQMDVAIRNLMHDLVRLLPDSDPNASRYKHLSESERHQILFYEKGAAYFGFLNLRDSLGEVSQIYRGLGNFYASKFLVDKENRAADATDLGRAKFYLDLAIQTFPDNTGAWNDRGMLATFIDHDDASAQMYFRSSLKHDDGQQRAGYNLAIIAAKVGTREGYEEAIGLLEAAIGKPKWETEPNEARRLDLFYNLACYQTLLAGRSPERSDTLLPDALKNLVIAKSGYDKVREAAFAADCREGGDLYLLAQTAPYAEQIAKMLPPSTV